MDAEQIAHAAELLRAARRPVALTGAGISTPSGVPDFRGSGGLWRDSDPQDVAALGAFQRDPQRFYRWFQPLLEQMLAAQPNPAHRALARLELAGRLVAVITQNIDGLHQRAGSREVYELHGHMRTATCIECDQSVSSERVIARARRGGMLRCGCGGPYKPDIVLFDELLPRGLYWLALRAVEQADLVLVAGTSLTVAPVCELPLPAIRRGARLVIVNRGPTYLDAQADAVVREDVAVALPAIVDAVLAPQGARAAG